MEWFYEDISPKLLINTKSFPNIYRWREGRFWLMKLRQLHSKKFIPKNRFRTRTYVNKKGLKISTNYIRKSFDYSNIPKSERKKHYAERFLIKFLMRVESYFDLSSVEYKGARHSWGVIIKQEQNICQICNSNKNLVAHHLIYASVEPRLSLSLNNGITLCKNCHKEVHLLDWFTIN